MKNIIFWVGGFCAAAAGFLLWDQRRIQPVQQLALQLEKGWADHHTVV